MNHGTRYGYKLGCRCLNCCDSARSYSRGAQERRRDRMRLGLIDPASELPVLDGLPAGEWVEKAFCCGRSEWELSENAMRSRRTAKFETIGIALSGCRLCDVINDCRTWVMSHTIDPCSCHVVAGMTPRERNAQRETLGMSVRGPRRGAA